MKNILIVESENDEYFIEALAKKISTETQIVRIDEYRHSSLDSKKLTTSLGTALTEATKIYGSKIGVILDMDNSNKGERIALINQCLTKAFNNCGFPEPKNLLDDTNKFVNNAVSDEMSVNVSCFFTNIDGEGELETVLKEIRSQESTFADCLYDGWKTCFTNNGKKLDCAGKQCDISEKEMLKLWVDFYKRFDTLKKADRDEKNTDWRGICLGKTKEKNETLPKIRLNEIFNLNSDRLDSIRSFLQMFN